MGTLWAQSFLTFVLQVINPEKPHPGNRGLNLGPLRDRRMLPPVPQRWTSKDLLQLISLLIAIDG